MCSQWCGDWWEMPELPHLCPSAETLTTAQEFFWSEAAWQQQCFWSGEKQSHMHVYSFHFWPVLRERSLETPRLQTGLALYSWGRGDSHAGNAGRDEVNWQPGKCEAYVLSRHKHLAALSHIVCLRTHGRNCLDQTPSPKFMYRMQLNVAGQLVTWYFGKSRSWESDLYPCYPCPYAKCLFSRHLYQVTEQKKQGRVEGAEHGLELLPLSALLTHHRNVPNYSNESGHVHVEQRGGCYEWLAWGHEMPAGFV